MTRLGRRQPTFEPPEARSLIQTHLTRRVARPIETPSAATTAPGRIHHAATPAAAIAAVIPSAPATVSAINGSSPTRKSTRNATIERTCLMARRPRSQEPRSARWRRRSTRTKISELTSVNAMSAGDRPVTARPCRTGALGRPEHAEGGQHHADPVLERVLGDPAQRSMSRGAGDHHHDDRRRRGDRGQRQVPLVPPECHDDERDLQALQEHALKADHEAVRVEPSGSTRAARPAATCSAKIASSSWSALNPLARRIALRSHCRPKTSSSPPTTRRSTPIGSAVRAGPRTATIKQAPTAPP